MMKLKAILALLLSMSLMVSCATGDKSGGADGETQEVSLDEEEKQELAERQEKVGGSHSKLRKLYKAKRYRELLSEASKILSKDEFDLRALSILGIYHMDMKQYGAARIMFEKALEKHEDESGLYNNIGVILLREGDLESAIVSFKKAYELESGNSVVQANLGSIYVKYMDYVEAEPLVEDAYSKMSDDVIVANNYAIVLRTQGQYEDAKKIYEKALSRNSRNISTNLNYAILLVEYMKNYEKARQIVNKIEFLNPTDRYVLARVKELQRKVSAAK
jgi:Flp pilus assembly protein TadD